ncbi:MAG TPA: ABC transporter permease, partial [Longimicrobiales bacterium]|nr:ABC transporter permease [Longimicrobiales bacterium]
MGRWARWILRLAAWMIPARERGEWTEEWRAELEALDELRRTVPLPEGLPTPVGFALGAIPHAVWTRTEGWSMGSVWQDVKFGVRVLRRSPGFTAVAALTLALGIGANASMFSLINGLLFRAPDQIAAPDRLVQVARSYDQAPRWDNFSLPAVNLIRDEARVFSGVAAYSPAAFTVGRGAETEQLLGAYVTGSYFEVLGVRPAVGRLLRPDDDVVPGAHAVVVLSHELWTRRFGGDPGRIGGTVAIGSEPYQVVGVAPPGFVGPESLGAPPELWVPVMQRSRGDGAPPAEEWGYSWLNTVARLSEGTTFVQARSAMEVVTDRLREASTQNEDIRVLLASGVGLDPQDRAEGEQLSFVLLIIVGVVLLLTCTNVANLFLARAMGRRTEVGVRLALGAGRRRLARQLLTESLLLAGLATLLAAPLVLLADRFVPLVFPYQLSVSVDADGRVWAFLVGVGLVAGLLFGAAPAWGALRRDMAR